MYQTFLSIERAIAYAQERAEKTCWYISVVPHINVHLRDYELQIIPFIHEDAIYVAAPKNWGRK